MLFGNMVLTLIPGLKKSVAKAAVPEPAIIVFQRWWWLLGIDCYWIMAAQ
jgi:hypothetical protein